MFGNNIPEDSLTFNMQNGNFLNSEIKLLYSKYNKKQRKTSVDFYSLEKKEQINSNKKNEKSENDNNNNNKLLTIKKNLMNKFDYEKLNINKEIILSNKINLLQENDFPNDEYKFLKAEDSKSNNFLELTKANSHIPKGKKKTSLLENPKIKNKKKKSLLRKSTSVPKLDYNEIEKIEPSHKDTIESTESSESPITKLIENKIEIEEKNLLGNNKSRKTTKDTAENMSEINDIDFDDESENEKFIELDNPYNELYFYLFENILEEYISSKFPKKEK